MSIQDTIAADQVAVTDAQAALDAANAKLAQDQATLAGIQPHLALLDQIENEIAAIEQNVDAAMLTALDSIKASIAPLIQQMRDLFNNA